MSYSQKYSILRSLGDFSIDTFLSEYWQQKPLFIKNAFPGFSSPIDANELAGFALESDVNSRLVEEHRDQNNEDHTRSNWRVTHGPLNSEVFSTLPEKNWSLLVQHVDSLDPEVNALLNAFRFIPNWRLDDIMVSYAPDGGGVGPHFDYFDVFLLQGDGKREWKLGQTCDKNSPLVPDQPMKLLKEFQTHTTIEMQAGDLLYIPAKLAHWGSAIGESITYSIGFRAPSHADFLLDYAQEIASHVGEDDRYRDSKDSLIGQATTNNSGEISEAAIATFQENIQSLVDKPELLKRWLGEYSTQLKCDIDDNIIPIAFGAIKHGKSAVLSQFCRAAYVSTSENNAEKNALLFINGRSWECSTQLAQNISAYRQIALFEYDGEDAKVVNEVANLDWLEDYG